MEGGIKPESYVYYNVTDLDGTKIFPNVWIDFEAGNVDNKTRFYKITRGGATPSQRRRANKY